jgi:hypothetical protein
MINNNTAAQQQQQAGIRPREDERAAAVPRWLRVCGNLRAGSLCTGTRQGRKTVL